MTKQIATVCSGLPEAGGKGTDLRICKNDSPLSDNLTDCVENALCQVSLRDSIVVLVGMIIFFLIIVSVAYCRARSDKSDTSTIEDDLGLFKIKSELKKSKSKQQYLREDKDEENYYSIN